MYQKSQSISFFSKFFLWIGLLVLSLVWAHSPVQAATSTQIINTSSTTNATQPSTANHVVSTSDGSLHAFIQIGTQTATCGGVSRSGLLWFNSTDSGATWTCQGQLSSDTTNQFFASAFADSSDNVYVVYSQAATGGGATRGVNYRKLTKGSGSTWTLESEQSVLSGSASTAYTYATLVVEGTTRIWMAVRYFDGTNYQVSTYYSSNLGTAPTWTLSQTALDTANTTSNRHFPTMARFGSKVGVIYNHDSTPPSIRWRWRADADGLTSWVSEQIISTGINPATATFNASGDAQGNIYVTINASTSSLTAVYNGTTWLASTLSSAAGGNTFASTVQDGHNFWAIYSETTDLASGLSGNRKLVFKKGVPPYAAESFDTSSTAIVDYHAVFDKVWTSIASTFTDRTTAAGSTTTADVTMPTNSVTSDAIYFGKTQKFDSLSWVVSTNGAGGVMTWEYWNGSTWAALTFTASSNTNFQGNGWGAFTDPSDWATTTVNSESTAYYYVRARVSTTYTTTPVGTQMAAIPQISWASFVSTPVSSKIHGIWTENASGIVKVRSTSFTVTPATANTAPASEISPTVLAYANVTTATQPSTMKNIIQTSDGTLHAFVQSENQLACGGTSGENNKPGLNWLTSTDSGTTWTCSGQLSSDITNLMYASATTDSDDNIYVVYSIVGSTRSTSFDIFYRKLTKGVGATWSIGSAQTVKDSTLSTTAYSYATIERDSNSRLWIAGRFADATSGTAIFSSFVLYSSDMSAAPTWTTSMDPLQGTVGTGSGAAFVSLARFSNKLGVVYTETATYSNITIAQISWRYRSDSDSPTSWSTNQAVGNSTTLITAASFSTVVDNSNTVHFVCNCASNVQYSYFNGTSWSTRLTITSSISTALFSSIATDGTNIFLLYADPTGLSSNLSGSRKIVYKKGSPPFAAEDFDSTATPVVTRHGTFQKIWSFVNGSYSDQTTAASNSTTGDVQMISSAGDILYFGSTSKFDAISWAIGTNGTIGKLAWEYWNGSQWIGLTHILRALNSTFGGHGYLNFIPHTDWATTTVNSESTAYYYVRARTTTSYSVSPVGDQFDSLPLISWGSLLPSILSNNRLAGMWTENANSQNRVRFGLATYPNAPTLLGPTSVTSAGQITETKPQFTFTLSSPNTSEYLQYRFQLSSSSDFSNILIDYTSGANVQGQQTFTVGQDTAGGSYSVGSVGQTLSSSNYYWRVRAIDSNSVYSVYAKANSGNLAFSIPSTSAPSTTQSQPTPPSCSSPPPGSKAPFLYAAIPQGKNAIQLYFAEGDGPFDRYALQFGTKTGEYTFGATNITGEGLRTYTVELLKPNTEYFFRIQAANGCAPGPWSNEISAKTTGVSLTTGAWQTVDFSQEVISAPTKSEGEATEEGSISHTVKVRVIDTTGQPISGATVTIHSNPQTKESDADGWVEFNNVETGQHRLIVEDDEYRGEQGLTVAEDTVTQVITLKLERKEPELLLPITISLGIGTLFGLLIALFIRRKKKK